MGTTFATLTNGGTATLSLPTGILLDAGESKTLDREEYERLADKIDLSTVADLTVAFEATPSADIEAGAEVMLDLHGLETVDGDLVLEAAEDKNITVETTGTGTVRIASEDQVNVEADAALGLIGGVDATMTATTGDITIDAAAGDLTLSGTGGSASLEGGTTTASVTGATGVNVTATAGDVTVAAIGDVSLRTREADPDGGENDVSYIALSDNGTINMVAGYYEDADEKQAGSVSLSASSGTAGGASATVELDSANGVDINAYVGNVDISSTSGGISLNVGGSGVVDADKLKVTSTAVTGLLVIDAADPGAIGAGAIWIDSDANPVTLKIRTHDNAGWLTATLT